MTSFLDRAFFVSTMNGGLFRHKVGASVIAVRRSGGSSSFDQLNKYLTYSEMVIAGSNYWNIIHGLAPEEIYKDEEGVQILNVLSNNVLWIMNMIEQTKGIIDKPKQELKVMTNFIR